MDEMDIELLPCENGERSSGETVDQSAFYVVRVPHQVFSDEPNETLKPEFEAVFKSYSPDVRFDYLRSFGLVLVTYPDPEQAEHARESLNHYIFQGTELRFKPVKAFVIGSQTLELPTKMRQHLLSPPASPPVDWEQPEEKAPSPGGYMDYSIVTALSRLQLPGTTQQLHKPTINTPGIVVITPEDDELDLTPTILHDQPGHHISLSALPPEFRHTARPSMPPCRS